MFEQKRQLNYIEGKMELEDDGYTRPKKQRFEEPPSKVLHLRSLPNDINERSVANLAIPFGLIQNILVTKNGQAMIEYQTQEAATSMHNFYTLNSPPVLGGVQGIGLQYSKHTELNTTSRSTTTEIIQASNNVHSSLDPNRRVLRIQVENPVTTPLGYIVFYQLLHRFGQINRIVTFKSGSTPQAFVEFNHPISLEVAKMQLDGCSLSVGGIVRTNYSRQEKLEVHKENQFCRDFILNPLDSELQVSSSGSGGVNVGAFANSANGCGPYAQLMEEAADAKSMNNTTISNYGECTGLREDRPAPTRLPSIHDLLNLDLGTLCAFANEVIQALAFVSTGYGGPAKLGIQSTINSMRELIPLAQVTGGGGGNSVASRVSQMNSVQSNSTWLGGDSILKQQQLLSAAASGILNTGVQQATGAIAGGNSVILVSQLSPEKITPDILFTLFGVYGDVQRVKILFKKKDNALVQYTDGQQATLAVQYLNGVPLLGNSIRCTHSRHASININYGDAQSTDADTSGKDLTRDFTGSRLHRYRNANSRNFQNICAPSCVLHVSSLPDDVTEAELRQLFSETSSHSIKSMKLMQNDTRRMALVEFDNLADSVDALIGLDAHQIRPTVRMRVTFSKYAIKHDNTPAF